MVTDFLGFKML